MKASYRDVVLRINDLTVSNGKKCILQGISEEIYDIVGHGQIIALLGPSGVGKSTFLNALAGLVDPDHMSGEVEIYHEKEKRLVPCKRGMIGIVGQKYPLLRHRTLLGNLMEAAKQRNGNASEAPAVRCEKYLKQFGLWDVRDKYPRQLSGGQRQRGAIVQQLLRSEHFIFMDEPFTGIDPVVKKEVTRMIKEAADLNEMNTIFVVTHDVRDAIAVADRIWMLGRDRDAQGDYTPARIKHNLDLIERGFAYHPNVKKAEGYEEFVDQIENYFYDL